MDSFTHDSPMVTHRGRGALSALAVGMVLTISAGCGAAGASKSDKASFITKADSICTTYDAQMRAVPRPPFNPAAATEADLPAAVMYLSQKLPIERSEAQALRGLGDPNQDAATFKQGLAEFDATIAHETEGLTAAQAANAESFRTAIAAGREAGPRGGALLQQFGLKVCGALPK